ncbi:glycosyl hydrolase family 28-related protein [Heyndrickxia coagulans]|uniref:glycosyl hydrolase family 28-related protein n=1 Tax=Heyndrickxia coagulans TaxID=1398 RepID=UPI000E525C70|nr:glycosyl hydrolase family 28-related protein [Heyndrickxia coagulans]RGR95828.1 hypothetical protein DWY16_12395 [Heyndrickxia coagulans]
MKKNWLIILLFFFAISFLGLQHVKQQNENNRTVSVKNFGAKGDGIHNDTKAFNLMLKNLVKYGGKGYIPNGKYRISGISINGHGKNKPFKIIGGKHSEIIGPDVKSGEKKSNVIHLENCNNILLKNLILRYKSVTQRDNNYKTLNINYGNNIKLENIEIKNSLSAGIVIDALKKENILIRNCIVHHTLADGILVANAEANVKILNNIVFDTSDDGIACLVFYAANNVFTNQVLIKENKVSNSLARGIVIAGTKNAKIKSNIINNTSNAGILVQWEPSQDVHNNVKENYYFVVKKNLIENIGKYHQTGEFPHGIVVNYKCKGGIIESNIIMNVTGLPLLNRGQANFKFNKIIN